MLEKLLKNSQLIDLTHSLHSNVPNWQGNCGFNHAIAKDYLTGYRTHNINMQAGIGTHMDAPCHFIPNAQSIADIPIEKLIVPTCVIDISNRNNPSYMLSKNDILDYERHYGKIAKNCLVIAYTGWDKYWKNPQQYRNKDANGDLQFPGFSKISAEMLIEREIAGIGIDTLSPDGSDMNFPVHHLVLGSDKYIIENLTNCDKLPAIGSIVIALPIKIQNGTESAIRAIAII